MEDAAGRSVTVSANLAGDFALIVEDGLTEPVASDEGIWRIPGPLVFPLRSAGPGADAATGKGGGA